MSSFWTTGSILPSSASIAPQRAAAFVVSRAMR
jgi:hypothetical protein